MRKLLQTAGLAAILAALPASSTHAADYHDNVVIVLDASGSMRAPLKGTGINKMEAAKSALKEVLRNVPPSTHVGLLVFSAKNIKDDWVYPLGPRDEAAFMRAIDQPQPDTGTPLGKYIKKGADRLLEERARQFGYGTYRLLIVTDGEAQDRELVSRFTPEIIARGITVDVIGVGMSARHTLATQVHSYRAANDPQALKRAIEEVFAEVSTQGSDTASDDVFDLIAPLPVETATALIQTLATTGNQPIGQNRPTPQPNPSTRPATSTSTSPATQHPGQTTRNSPPQKTPAVWTVLKAVFVVGVAGAVLLVTLLVILIKVMSGRKRR